MGETLTPQEFMKQYTKQNATEDREKMIANDPFEQMLRKAAKAVIWLGREAAKDLWGASKLLAKTAGNLVLPPSFRKKRAEKKIAKAKSKSVASQVESKTGMKLSDINF